MTVKNVGMLGRKLSVQLYGGNNLTKKQVIFIPFVDMGNFLMEVGQCLTFEFHCIFFHQATQGWQISSKPFDM